MDLHRGEDALRVAVKWASRNLKKIQQSTIEIAMDGIRHLWMEGRTAGMGPSHFPGHRQDLKNLEKGGALSKMEDLQTQGAYASPAIASEGEEDKIWILVDEVAGSGLSQTAQEDQERRGEKRRRPVGDQEGARENLQREEECEDMLDWNGFERQEHGNHKLENWYLRPRRPILKLGDSNLAKLPRMGDDRIQIMCYPGARWLHAQQILRNKTPTTDWVTKVILSFGINDRTSASTGWVGQWIEKAVSAAQTTFPNAQILVPIINFNRNLSRYQIQNLSTIFEHISNNRRTISLLPYQLFRTGSDLTHWTKATGRAMWEHWLNHLNWCRGEPLPNPNLG